MTTVEEAKAAADAFYGAYDQKRFPNRDELFNVVRFLDDYATADEFKSAVVTFASLFLDRSLTRIVKTTGFTRVEVKVRMLRLRRAGIWTDTGVVCQWIDDETGLTFVVDWNIAHGRLVCDWTEDGPLYHLASPLELHYDKPVNAHRITPYTVARGLHEQHGIEPIKACKMAWYGWAQNATKLPYSERSLRYWMGRARRWPVIPADVLDLWAAEAEAAEAEPSLLDFNFRRPDDAKDQVIRDPC